MPSARSAPSPQPLPTPGGSGQLMPSSPRSRLPAAPAGSALLPSFPTPAAPAGSCPPPLRHSVLASVLTAGRAAPRGWQRCRGCPGRLRAAGPPPAPLHSASLASLHSSKCIFVTAAASPLCTAVSVFLSPEGDLPGFRFPAVPEDGPFGGRVVLTAWQSRLVRRGVM